jgi:hypothetical protein
MRKLLSFEEAAQFLFCLMALYVLKGPIQVQWLLIVFFVPDLFAIGYLLSNRAGTFMYNFSHHKAMPILLIIIGYTNSLPIAIQLGILWFAHITFDRTIGYGLKHLGNPNHTHLGYIGKEKFKNE